MTITVIILNYNRPHNLDKLIPEIVNYSDISEIIISHGKKDTEKIINHPKIINETKLRNIYYAATRYEVAKLANNEIILYLNDDFLPSESLIKKLLENYYKHGENAIYGPFSNRCTVNGCTPSSFLPFYPYNGVQSGLAMISKTFSLKVWDEIKKNKEFNIMMEYKGNGDDIIFSHYVNKLNGKNIYVSGSFKDLDSSNGYSTNSDYNKFSDERDYLCKIMKRQPITDKLIIYYIGLFTIIFILIFIIIFIYKSMLK